jgi:hypothetical protein
MIKSYLSSIVTNMSVFSVEHVVVTDDPGSKPDQRYARRRERQITFGKSSINLGLRAERIPSWYDILVHCEGADFEVVVVKFVTVFVARRDSAYS